MNTGSASTPSGSYNYSISNITVRDLNEVLIQAHSAESFNPQEKGFLELPPESIEINSALFINEKQNISTWVIQQNDNLLLSCSCRLVNNKLCSHQAQSLYNILMRTELRIFFDKALRTDKLKKFAEPYGLQDEKDLGQYFHLIYRDKTFSIKPVSASLIPVSADTLKLNSASSSSRRISNPDKETFVVLKLHKY